ncbi:MAG: hypothetical protein K0Q73_8224 [Paenibacillus sp.]|nr:hypothetical protein [Paenibacillus sp.]
MAANRVLCRRNDTFRSTSIRLRPLNFCESCAVTNVELISAALRKRVTADNGLDSFSTYSIQGRIREIVNRLLLLVRLPLE